MTLAHLLLLLENSLRGKEDDKRELIWEMQSELGTALTEPENKISQHHVGSRAEAENFHSWPDVFKCNLPLSRTSHFTKSDSVQKSNKKRQQLPSFQSLGPCEHLSSTDC